MFFEGLILLLNNVHSQHARLDLECRSYTLRMEHTLQFQSIRSSQLHFILCSPFFLSCATNNPILRITHFEEAPSDSSHAMYRTTCVAIFKCALS